MNKTVGWWSANCLLSNHETLSSNPGIIKKYDILDMIPKAQATKEKNKLDIKIKSFCAQRTSRK
jgi:hypothetical protein